MLFSIKIGDEQVAKASELGEVVHASFHRYLQSVAVAIHTFKLDVDWCSPSYRQGIQQRERSFTLQE